jgi:peptidoglycan/LPS O-acetylase OafA/YrhL
MVLAGTFRNIKNYVNYYYYLTHTRCPSWFIGVILGYYIYKLKRQEFRLELNKTVVWIIWGVCLGTMLTCVLGGFNSLRGEEYYRWGNAFYIALVRPVWCLAISWVILACTNDYGGDKKKTKKSKPTKLLSGPINWVLSLPIYQVLNRFTYTVYLTHVTILYMITYDKKHPGYFSNINVVGTRKYLAFICT